MKQSIKMTLLTIPKKLKMELRLFVDDSRSNILYEGMNQVGGVNSSIFNPFPNIILNILRENIMDENGRYTKPPWNPNDSLMMTKMNLPIFYNELKNIYRDMTISDLYKYHGKRLELDEKIAESIRKVFMIGNITVELSAVVITNDGVNGVEYAEGIKIKFNNEISSVVLTLNETYSLLWNINHLDIDNLSIQMFHNFYKKDINESIKENNNIEVDIKIPEKKFNDVSLSMVDEDII